MSTVYVPRLIESAEQAEALPTGTVAVLGPHEDGPMSFLRSDGNAPPWYASTDGDSHTSNGEMVGCIALVPIEAEEEWRASWPEDDAHQRCRDERTARLWADQQDAVAMSRLVTPWEAV